MMGAFLLRTTSSLLHSLMGGMAVFCLIYAAILPDPETVASLLLQGGQWGVLAWFVLYFRCKYLER